MVGLRKEPRTMTLSDTHLMVLSAAAARPDKLVTRHKRLPGASRKPR
jgi:hypothetical protein